MKQSVKISVVLPVYNGQETVAKAIESVINQSVKPFEIIAVDDGSTDDTVNVIKDYKEVILISQKNAGPSEARNTGIKNATGNYIAFIDCDDIWKSDKLEKQMEVVHKNPEILFVFTNIERFDCYTGKKFPMTNTDFNTWIYDLDYISQENLINNRIFNTKTSFRMLLRGYPLYPSTMMIQKELLFRIGLWNKKFPRCQDYDLSLRCSKFTSFCYIDESLVSVGRHLNNISREYLGQLEEDIEVMEFHLGNTFFSEEEKCIIKKYLARRLLGLAWNYLNESKPIEARKTYLRGLKYRSSFIPSLARLPFTLQIFNGLWNRIKRK